MGRKHYKKEEASIILEILNRIPLSKRFVSVDDILNSLASADDLAGYTEILSPE